ncbi:hypothetical protein, partial [Klebsiella pneumoniae]|uniref:hypothetical protein n=1 Tax=Klebsiella pneumoniae TaxID=573 RepID=UPI003A8737B3
NGDKSKKKVMTMLHISSILPPTSNKYYMTLSSKTMKDGKSQKVFFVSVGIHTLNLMIFNHFIDHYTTIFHPDVHV